jgi:lysophospholipase L1-like esterase
VVLVVALALLAAAPGADAAGGGGVLVVGDSLEELTSPDLGKYLPGVPLTVNAVGGSNSFEILDLFKESYAPSQSVIVFDAGTNDNPAYPQILAENLQVVSQTVGDRCMVVPTVHGYTVNGVNNDGKNRTVAEFAASRPGTETPDWAGAVAARPDLLQSDGLHPTEAGAEVRARLIAAGIRGCLAYERLRAAPPVPRSKLRPIAFVGKLQSRQQSLLRNLSTDVIRQALAVLMARMLLPLGGP